MINIVLCTKEKYLYEDVVDKSYCCTGRPIVINVVLCTTFMKMWWTNHAAGTKNDHKLFQLNDTIIVKINTKFI